LPGSYLSFLAYSNGGEGPLAIEPAWFGIWPAEQFIDLNHSYKVDEWLPGFFGFGSSGGGELLAFDTRTPEPWKVVTVPFIPLDEEDAIVIAGSFEELVKAMGYEYPED